MASAGSKLMMMRHTRNTIMTGNGIGKRGRGERRRQEHLERKRRRGEAARNAGEAAVVEPSDDHSGDEYTNKRRFEQGDLRTPSGQAVERGTEQYYEKDKWRDDVRERHGGHDRDRYESDRRRKSKAGHQHCSSCDCTRSCCCDTVGVLVSKKSSHSSSAPANSNLGNISESSIRNGQKARIWTHLTGTIRPTQCYVHQCYGWRACMLWA